MRTVRVAALAAVAALGAALGVAAGCGEKEEPSLSELERSTPTKSPDQGQRRGTAGRPG
jgi:hypothetical protein